MREYCPECGQVIEPEVGYGCSCSCGWSGLIASNDPRRDTRSDEQVGPATRSRNQDDQDDQDWCW
jgi:hypothetical protein